MTRAERSTGSSRASMRSNRGGPATAPLGVRAILAVCAAVLRRPSLWVVALRQAHRIAPRRWWRSFPPLPIPRAEYLRFRLVTAYGGTGSADPDELAGDVVAYLRWCAGGPGPARGPSASDASDRHGER